MIKSLIKRKTLTANIGIALSLVGVPLGMHFNFIFPFFEWSPIIMFFSLIFIISYSSLINLKLPSFRIYFLFILFFQFMMLGYGVYSDNLDNTYLSYHLYVIFLIISLSTLPKQYSFNNLISTVFYVSIVSSVLGAFFSWNGLVTSEIAYQLRQINQNYPLEPFTVAYGGLINLVAAIFLLQKKDKFKIIYLIFVLVDIYILFASGKRTPLFLGFFIVAIVFYKKTSLTYNDLLKAIKILGLIAIVILTVYFIFDIIKNEVNKFSYDLFSGILNILGFQEIQDTSGSAIIRYENRLWMYDYIDVNFNLFNYIFGAGYMTRWLDNPILQAYLDMGLLGIIFYTGIVVVYPLIKLIKTNNILTLFIVSFCMYNVLSAISSGNPYQYFKYVPIILLIFVSNSERITSYHTLRLYKN